MKILEKKDPMEELVEILNEIEGQSSRIRKCEKEIEALGFAGFEQDLVFIVRRFSPLSRLGNIAPDMESLKEKIEKQREKEHKEIEKIFTEAKALTKRAASVCKKPEILAGLMLLGVEFSGFFQKFSEGSINYQEVKVALLNSLEQAKILSSATPIQEEDYYEILGVSPETTPEKIKEVYYQKMKEYHPDKQPSGSKDWVIKQAVQMTKKIIQAYEILGDSEKKKKYDVEFFGEVERE